MKIRHAIISGLVLAGTIGFASGTAGAASSLTINLTCGTTTDAVTGNGNGQWTSVRSTTSTRVYIPVSFGAFTGTVRDANGTIVEQFTDPGGQVKGKNGTGVSNTTTCSYAFSEVSDGSDPDFPAGFTFEGSGDVTLLWTPRGS